MTQLTYLEAIDATNAGTATVLQYLCPIGVLAYSCVMTGILTVFGNLFDGSLAIAGPFSLQPMVNSINWQSLLGASLGTCFCLCLCSSTSSLPIQLIQKWGSMLVIGIGMLIPGLVMIPFTGRRLFHGQYSMDNLMGFSWLSGWLGPYLPYTVFWKGQLWLTGQKVAFLQLLSLFQLYFCFCHYEWTFLAIDFIEWLWSSLRSSWFPYDLMIQKKKESCKTKPIIFQLKGWRRRSWPFYDRESYHYIAYT